MALLLEPTKFEPAKVYQKALFEAGIPWIAFFVEDIQCELVRMEDLGVRFKSKPARKGPVIVAIFEDTCGNLIHILQK